MIEVVAALVIISFLTVLAIVRYSSVDTESLGSREVIKNHIRLAQILAMKSDNVCGVRFNGFEYWVFKNNSINDKVILANDTVAELPISSKLGTASETIYFDLWGTPYSDSSLSAPRATSVIGSLGISIITDTGFVQ